MTKYRYFISFTRFASKRGKTFFYDNNEFIVNEPITNLTHVRMVEGYMQNNGVTKPKVVSFQLFGTFEVEDEVPTQSSETLNSEDDE